MSKRDGEESRRVWWQDKLDEQEKIIKQLEKRITEDDPERTWYSKMKYFEQLANENQQRKEALENKVARMDRAASNLLQSHEEMLAVIENFSKYAENYSHGTYAPRMTMLATEARKAAQKFRRER
jgi:hypothetical protein